jgi:protease IV
MLRKKRWIFLLLVVLIGIGVVILRWPPTIAPGSYLLAPIGGSYTDAPMPDLARELVGASEKNLTDLLLQLQKASVDERLRGVVLRITPLDLPLAQLQELRGAVSRLRDAGKHVIAWVMGEDFSGNGEYYLASAADQVYFSENSLLPLIGLHSSYLFLGGVWDKLDVDMQVEQVKEYKTFGDFLVRKTMSDAHREMANSILDNLNTQLLRDIAESRRLTPDDVQRLIDAPTLIPEDFQQAGLIDGMPYFDDLLDSLKGPDGAAAETVSLDTYRRVKPASLGLMQGPKVAVVFAIGGITTGQSGWNALGLTMGADTLTEAIDAAAKNEAIKAIVLRVDSPGGSALASDLIWHAVARAKRAKPVIVSMSGAAASGGYYIAAGATKIVAQPATITGSIGIVFSHANVQGLLTKLGINSETLDRGQYARLFSNMQSWTPEERQQVERVTEALYQTFTRKVAAGRSLDVETVDRIGRGRVWTGEQAKELGLVDHLGGMDTAIQLAKEAVGIAAEESVTLVYYPKPQGLLTVLLERFIQPSAVPLPLPQPLQDVVAHLIPFMDAPRGPLLMLPALPRFR